MKPTHVHRIALATLIVPTAAALLSSCALPDLPATKPAVKHGEVVKKREYSGWWQPTYKYQYACTTTQAHSAAFAIGRGGGSSSSGFGRSGSGKTGGSTNKKPDLRKPSTRKPGNGGTRRNCRVTGRTKTGRIWNPARFELKIRAKDGRTAWRSVNVTVYRHTKIHDWV
ncbi:hypothetical protein [Streptomyces sp. NPDC097610]|uniref:hypothetical protein n=1 Tax=Streptomyces sp. NPDC097610 TaxID=3157227 RepID=UPI003334959C